MDVYSSYIVSECTEQEIELLEEDKEFQRRLQVRQRTEEKNLLEKLDSTINIAASKGNASPLIWKLGIINEERYNKQAGKKDPSPDIKNAIVFSSEHEVGTKEELSAYDNVEVFGGKDDETV